MYSFIFNPLLEFSYLSYLKSHLTVASFEKTSLLLPPQASPYSLNRNINPVKGCVRETLLNGLELIPPHPQAAHLTVMMEPSEEESRGPPLPPLFGA